MGAVFQSKSLNSKQYCTGGIILLYINTYVRVQYIQVMAAPDFAKNLAQF